MTSDQIADQIQKAIALIDVQRFELAEKVLREVLAVEPNHINALFNLSRALMHQDKDKESFEAIDNALSLDAGNPYNHLMKATIAGHFDLRELAIVHLKKAIEIDPGLSQAYGLLAIYEFNERNYKAAKQYAKFGLERDPEDVNSLNALAALKGRKGFLLGSSRHSKEALAIDPEASHSLYNSAVLAFMTFRFRHAFNLGRSGLSIEPDSENLLWMTRRSLLSMFLPYGIVLAIHMNLIQKFKRVYLVIGAILFFTLPYNLMNAHEALSYNELMFYLQWAIIILCSFPLLNALAHVLITLTPHRVYLAKVIVFRSFLIILVVASCIVVLNNFPLETAYEKVSKLLWHALAILYLVAAIMNDKEKLPTIRRVVIVALVSMLMAGVYLQMISGSIGTIILFGATVLFFMEFVLNIAKVYDRSEV